LNIFNVKSNYLWFVALTVLLTGCSPAYYYTNSIAIAPVQTNLPINATGTISIMSEDQTLYHFDFVNGEAQVTATQALYNTIFVSAGIKDDDSKLRFFDSMDVAQGQVFDFNGSWGSLLSYPKSVNAVRFDFDGYEPVTLSCNGNSYEQIIVKETPEVQRYGNNADHTKNSGLMVRLYKKDCGANAIFTEASAQTRVEKIASRNIDPPEAKDVYILFDRAFEVAIPQDIDAEILLAQTTNGQFRWLSESCTSTETIISTGTRLQDNTIIKRFEIGSIESIENGWYFPRFYLMPRSGAALQGKEITLTSIMVGSASNIEQRADITYRFPQQYYLPIGNAYFLATISHGKSSFGPTPTDFDMPRDHIVDASQIDFCNNRVNAIFDVTANLPASFAAGEEIVISLAFDSPFVFSSVDADTHIQMQVGNRVVNAPLIMPTNWEEVEYSRLNFSLVLQSEWQTTALEYLSPTALNLAATKLKSAAPISTLLPEPGDTGSLSPLNIEFAIGPASPVVQSISAQAIAGAGVSSVNPHIGINSSLAQELVWLVSFDMPVGNVSADDFIILENGSASATITSVQAAEQTLLQMRKDSSAPVYQSAYYVYASQVQGEGLLQLGMAENNDIVSRKNASLAAFGQAVQQQQYLLLNSAPKLAFDEFEALNNDEYREIVYFNQEIVGLDRSDFEQAAYIEQNQTYDTYDWHVQADNNRYVYQYRVTGNINGASAFRSRLSASNNIRNLAGIYMDGSTDGSGSVDTIFPEIIAIDALDTVETNASSVSFDIIFSEDVNFDITDFAISNGNNDFDLTNLVTSVAGQGDSYVVTLSDFIGDGELSFNKVPGSRGTTDLNGNSLSSGQYYSVDTYLIDKTSPFVTSISRDQAQRTEEETLSFTVVFSESVSGVTTNDFALDLGEGMSAEILSINGDSNRYQIIVAQLSGTGAVGLNAKQSPTIVDNAGNTLTQGFTNGESYLYRINPTVTITHNGGELVSGDVAYTILFSEPVVGFTSDDIIITGGVNNAFTKVSDTEYTLAVSPLSNSDADLIVDIAADVATNAPGYGNAPRQITIPVDTAAPQAPTLELANDTGLSNSDNITTDGTLKVAMIEANALWEYSLNNAGSWNIGNKNSFVLPEGSNLISTILVRQTDTAGNTSPVGRLNENIEVDNQSPIASLEVSTGSFSTGIRTDVYPEGIVGKVRITPVGVKGEFVLAWEGQDGFFDYINKSIFVQKFTANGSAIGSQVQLTGTNPERQADYNPQVTGLGDSGAYVVTWVGEDTGLDTSIFVQQFDANNLKVGEQHMLEHPESTNTGDNSQTVMSLYDDSYLVAWSSFDENYSNRKTFIQQFNNDGTKATKQPLGVDMYDSTLAKWGDNGAFVVAGIVREIDNPSKSWVALQLVDENFNLQGPTENFRAQNTSKSHMSVNATTLGDGGFVIGWRADESPQGDGRNEPSVFLQRYNAAGDVGDFAQVKLEATGNTQGYDQIESILSLGNNGSFVVTWSGYEPDGDTSVYVQQFDANGNLAADTVKLEAIGLTDGSDRSSTSTLQSTDGRYAVAFIGGKFGVVDIFTQQFNADGTISGDMLQVPANEQATDYNNLSFIAQDSSGRSIVAWKSALSFSDATIDLQALNADGTLRTDIGEAVSAISTKAGTAYLVEATITVNSVSDITSADTQQWTSISLSEANVGVSFITDSLKSGDYKVYTLDVAGNLSSASTDSFTLNAVQSD
jgi:hypothetical protein